MRPNATSADSTFGARPEDLARDGVAARALGRELHEHGHRAVRLGGGSAKKRSATSRCTITHQRSSASGDATALGDERRGDVVRQVRDELARRRVERGEVEPERVAEVEPRRCLRRCRRRCGSSDAVELDGVHDGDPLGEVIASARRAPGRPRARRPRASSSASRPITREHVLVDEEVLAERLLRRHRRVTPPEAERRVGVGVDLRSSSSAPTPRTPASTRAVWAMNAGSLRCPRTACGARYGLSVSASSRSAGHPARRLAQLVGLRVGDVARERDVPAALERRLEQRRREKQCRTTVPRERRPARSVSSSSRPRVWMTTGLPSSPASSSWRVEQLAAARSSGAKSRK